MLVGPAILREWNAVYILHDEPRRSVLECIGIVEARDQRMIELRQCSLFAGETFAAGRGNPGIPQNLDCDLGAEVVAFGKINDSHTSFTEQLQDPVRTE